MWYSGVIVLHTCPVLELDDDAAFYLEWMVATHQPTEHGWLMTQLPGPGGVGDQDALLMQGIALARDEANAYMREQVESRQRDERTAAHFDRVERESRA